MSRRFALLFISTFIVVFLIRVPTLATLFSASQTTLFQTDAAVGTVLPSPPVISLLSTELPLPIFSDSSDDPPERSLPVSVKYRFYPIAGTTANELRSQMVQKSPVYDAQGRSFDALTNWSVYWDFRYTQKGKTCSARAVNTYVDVTFTLPQWSVPNFVSSGLQAEWSSYMKALTLHEEGHKKNGIGAAKAVLKALQQLPAYPDCRELEKAAKEMANQVIAIHNRYDIEYDRATGHGRTQGAVFPIVNASGTVPNPSS